MDRRSFVNKATFSVIGLNSNHLLSKLEVKNNVVDVFYIDHKVFKTNSTTKVSRFIKSNKDFIEFVSPLIKIYKNISLYNCEVKNKLVLVSNKPKSEVPELIKGVTSQRVYMNKNEVCETMDYIKSHSNKVLLGNTVV